MKEKEAHQSVFEASLLLLTQLLSHSHALETLSSSLTVGPMGGDVCVRGKGLCVCRREGF